MYQILDKASLLQLDISRSIFSVQIFSIENIIFLIYDKYLIIPLFGFDTADFNSAAAY
jgi:hypothetical protein